LKKPHQSKSPKKEKLGLEEYLDRLSKDFEKAGDLKALGAVELAKKKSSDSTH